jgi:choline dehydrogenase
MSVRRTLPAGNVIVFLHFRVRGMSNLRIIDASIMPTQISGNTNAAVVMIGEKGSDMIRGIQSVNKLKLDKLK